MGSIGSGGAAAGVVAPPARCDRATPSPALVADTPFRLSLLRSFSLLRIGSDGAGSVVELPGYARRLLAYLALRPENGDRCLVASSLWLDTDEPRAAANLRTALWKIRQVAPGLVECDSRSVRLGPQVAVDLHEAVAEARREIEGVGAPASRWDRFRSEVLPEWYDDWVIVERERFRQLRLHALEALALRLCGEARHGEAVDAAQAAVAAEPLRESAQRTLICIHLAEGNRSEAWRQLRLYEGELRVELGVGPSEQLLSLLR